MPDGPMTRRLQLLLDEERYRRVSDAAARDHRSVAAVIRDAIDQSLAPTRRRRGAAAARILAADPLDVAPGDGLLAELDEVRASR